MLVVDDRLLARVILEIVLPRAIPAAAASGFPLPRRRRVFVAAGLRNRGPPSGYRIRRGAVDRG